MDSTADVTLPLRRLPRRYEIGEAIGSGGMGTVYRAHDSVLGRDVAIKVIETSPEGSSGTQPRDRFVREARAAARLAHPNIVAVHDVDPEAGWLVMDLIEGESLREVVARGPTPAAVARRYAEQVLSALDAAHAAGVIHRDIKPSNIIVDKTGKVTLVDFGVARLVDAELTKTGEALGTPAYMAPEQLRGGKVDARTDLYGLAATLFELVSAERMVAFETPSPAVLARVAAACADEPGLGYVIERCLQADPGARLPSAREAIAALAHRPQRYRPWITAAAIAAVAIGVSVAVIAVKRDHEAIGDAREAEIFVNFQRGEHQKAALLLDQYLQERPHDPEARMMKLLADWWQTGFLDDTSLATADLTPMHRDMVHGISLFANRHEIEAIAFLEEAERRYPGKVEIVYALGEARWHGQQLERGVETLERAFAIDPRWQIALHHVFELRQSRGEIDRLESIVKRVRTVDTSAAAAMDCQLAIGRRNYEDAARRAATAVEHEQPIPALYVCLLQAQILSGDLAAAERTAKQALARWPIDLRPWGGSAIEAELALYRGKLDEYLELPGVKAGLQRLLVLALWRPTADLVPAEGSSPTQTRGAPLQYATEVLIAHELGDDPTEVYTDAPEPEIRAFGKALALELRGDPDGAIAEYRKALAAPAKGDIRMLVAHELARVLHAKSDIAGTIAACEEVVAPRVYQGYRAVLLPDCLLWSNNRKQWQWLVDAWSGGFAHPAVVEARRQLAAP